MTDTNTTTASTPRRGWGLGRVFVTLLGLAIVGFVAIFVGTTIGLRLDGNCFSWDNWGQMQSICFSDNPEEELLIPPARKDGDTAPAHVVIDDDKAEVVSAAEVRASPPVIHDDCDDEHLGAHHH